MEIIEYEGAGSTRSFFPRIYFTFEEEDDFEFESMAAIDCE